MRHMTPLFYLITQQTGQLSTSVSKSRLEKPLKTLEINSDVRRSK
jgi:hypothetical protein